MQEEAKAKAKRSAQARASIKAVILAVAFVAISGAGIAVAGDYVGMWSLGIFPHPSEKPAPVAVRATTPAPIAPLVVQAPSPRPAPPAQPVAAPVAIVPVAAAPVARRAPDAAELRRAEDRLKSKQRGVDLVSRDLAEVRAKIDGDLISLIGFVPTPRDREIQPADWQSHQPNAIFTLVQVSKETGIVYNVHLIRQQNAQAMVDNLTNELEREKRLEHDILSRLDRAISERDDAKYMLDQMEK
ncbi:MAG: hypothetical protein KGN77_05145 [Xanthomonadaceae bacterium]|nr:hypothetical protein [Xanthomonadaceae bacterium]